MSPPLVREIARSVFGIEDRIKGLRPRPGRSTRVAGAVEACLPRLTRSRGGTRVGRHAMVCAAKKFRAPARDSFGLAAGLCQGGGYRWTGVRPDVSTGQTRLRVATLPALTFLSSALVSEYRRAAARRRHRLGRGGVAAARQLSRARAAQARRHARMKSAA